LERTEIKLILESLLFSTETPMRLEKLNEIFPDTQLKDLREIMSELKEEYDTLNRSFAIRKLPMVSSFTLRQNILPGSRNLKKFVRRV